MYLATALLASIGFHALTLASLLSGQSNITSIAGIVDEPDFFRVPIVPNYGYWTLEVDVGAGQDAILALSIAISNVIIATPLYRPSIGTEFWFSNGTEHTLRYDLVCGDGNNSPTP